MSLTIPRSWRAMMLTMLALPAGGCSIATDLVSPGFLATLGFDPSSIIPPQGSVVVTFNNQTNLAADFFVAISDSTRDPTSNAKNLVGADVAANGVRNRVVECPIGVITPGEPAVDFTTGTVAVQLTAADGTVTDVNYDGTPLVAGTHFVCGDVVEISVVQRVDAAGMVTFAIEIQVVPGR